MKSFSLEEHREKMTTFHHELQNLYTQACERLTGDILACLNSLVEAEADAFRTVVTRRSQDLPMIPVGVIMKKVTCCSYADIGQALEHKSRQDYPFLKGFKLLLVMKEAGHLISFHL